MESLKSERLVRKLSSPQLPSPMIWSLGVERRDRGGSCLLQLGGPTERAASSPLKKECSVMWYSQSSESSSHLAVWAVRVRKLSTGDEDWLFTICSHHFPDTFSAISFSALFSWETDTYRWHLQGPCPLRIRPIGAFCRILEGRKGEGRCFRLPILAPSHPKFYLHLHPTPGCLLLLDTNPFPRPQFSLVMPSPSFIPRSGNNL